MTDDAAPKILHRELRAEDRNFVLGTWLHHARRRVWRHDPAGSDYDAGHSAAIAACLSRSSATVACLADDEYVILGWACWERGVLHYCYVKPEFRRLGIARSLLALAGLLEDDELTCSHWSPDLKSSFGRDRWVRYDPYRFFGGAA
jgi:ribosomal protein S18 acetylase RimI-like enzyme